MHVSIWVTKHCHVLTIMYCSTHWWYREPWNTSCKPTHVSSSSIIIFPAAYRVAAGGIWGQLERWLAGHHDWRSWTSVLSADKWLSPLWHQVKERDRGTKWQEEPPQNLWGHTGESESSPCSFNMLHIIIKGGGRALGESCLEGSKADNRVNGKLHFATAFKVECCAKRKLTYSIKKIKWNVCCVLQIMCHRGTVYSTIKF